MPGIRDFGIISELGWDYDVKLFEDGPPILKIVMARDMGSSKGSTSPIYSVNPADDQFRELASRASHFRL